MGCAASVSAGKTQSSRPRFCQVVPEDLQEPVVTNVEPAFRQHDCAKCEPDVDVTPIPQPEHSADKTDLSMEKVLTGAPCVGSGQAQASDPIQGTKAASEQIEVGTMSLNSYFYSPSERDIQAGFPIAPCAPLHHKHVKNMEEVMKLIIQDPTGFKDFVAERREGMQLDIASASKPELLQ
jgi:hypothetical protein